MELDAELIEARLRERAHALGRRRGIAQLARAPVEAGRDPAEAPGAVVASRQHASSGRRALGFRRERTGIAVCQDCTSEIASERLAAVPGAARCMVCQRSFEREGSSGRER